MNPCLDEIHFFLESNNHEEVANYEVMQRIPNSCRIVRVSKKRNNPYQQYNVLKEKKVWITLLKTKF